jgi:hypothetical protein
MFLPKTLLSNMSATVTATRLALSGGSASIIKRDLAAVREGTASALAHLQQIKSAAGPRGGKKDQLMRTWFKVRIISESSMNAGFQTGLQKER